MSDSPAIDGAPLFPRAVSTFVGRTAEVARVLDLLDRETLFTAYGVGGIGKSELLYKVVEEARKLPAWREAVPILVEVKPHLDVQSVLAVLRTNLGVTPVEGPGARDTSFAAELAQTARALDAGRYLVVIDDVHHLDPARVAKMLGYLSRHVRASRIFTASRLETPLLPDAPAPVITRVATLDERDTGEMVTMLSRRLGIDAPDHAEVYRRSNGSPFFIQRELVSSGRRAPTGEDDSLESSLRQLAPSTCAALALASVVRGRIAERDLRSHAPEIGEALEELSLRFLVETERGAVSVHNLVRDALLRVVSDDEIAAANRSAATLYAARFGRTPAPLDVVEAVHHLVAARAFDEAWSLVEAHYRLVAAAGVDHLLADELRLLGDAVAEHRLEAELLRARVLVRRSMIGEAQEILDTLAFTHTEIAVSSYRYAFLAGEVAQRSGKLERAEQLFRSASAAAEDETDRFRASLQLATITCLRGAGVEARAVLDSIITDVEPLPRHRGRWEWTRVLSYALEERHVEAADEARRAAEAIRGHGLDDLVVRLALLEIASRVEVDDVSRAERLVTDVLDAAASSGALREQVASLYRGVVLFGGGDMRGARVLLDSAFEYLSGHRDNVYACIAGRFLASCAIALGDIDTGLETTTRTAAHAEAAGLGSLAARVAVDHAQLSIAAGDLAGARDYVDKGLARPLLPVHARMLGRCVLARAHALDGDDTAALDELDQAAAAIADDAFATHRYELALERAEISLLLGDAPAVVSAADAARTHYARAGRRHFETRACLALAGGYAALGGDADLALAEQATDRAVELITDHHYTPLVFRSAVVEAAIDSRKGERGRARDFLTGVLRSVGATSRTLDAQILRAALQPDVAANLPVGVTTLLATVGLAGAGIFTITTATGSRTGAAADVAAELERRDLVVELDSGVITGKRGAASVKARPITCRLLAALIDSGQGVLTPEDLYTRVWDSDEYHPLKHRNTIYVALNRLRKSLREIFGDRDIIEKMPEGWRIAADVDAAAIASAEA